LFNEVCDRNLEGVVAKRKTGTYSTVSGWLKIKNPAYTQSEQRHELFDSFKAKQTKQLPPIPKKPPCGLWPCRRKLMGKGRGLALAHFRLEGLFLKPRGEFKACKNGKGRPLIFA
jgi:hypothetical protein